MIYEHADPFWSLAATFEPVGGLLADAGVWPAAGIAAYDKTQLFCNGDRRLFYWIYAGTATFMLLYELNDGGVRMYAVAGVFTGMILYDKIVSRFLFAALKKAGKWFKIKRNR